MWTTDSLWFEVAIVSIIYALGNITMGHLEERTPRIRRVSKYVLTVVVTCALSVFLGRSFALGALALLLVPAIYVHGYFLPRRKGINGWTGEPKARYYEFRGWDKNIFGEK